MKKNQKTGTQFAGSRRLYVFFSLEPCILFLCLFYVFERGEPFFFRLTATGQTKGALPSLFHF